MRFLTLVRLPLFTLHRKCKTLRRLSPGNFGKSVLKLLPSTLYDAERENVGISDSSGGKAARAIGNFQIFCPRALRILLVGRAEFVISPLSMARPRQRTQSSAESMAKRKIAPDRSARRRIVGGNFRGTAAKSIASVFACVCPRYAVSIACMAHASARAGRFAHDVRATLRRDPINRRPRALLEAPLAQIRSRSSFPVTA
jgi:hypothetical protein